MQCRCVNDRSCTAQRQCCDDWNESSAIAAAASTEFAITKSLMHDRVYKPSQHYLHLQTVLLFLAVAELVHPTENSVYGLRLLPLGRSSSKFSVKYAFVAKVYAVFRQSIIIILIISKIVFIVTLL